MHPNNGMEDPKGVDHRLMLSQAIEGAIAVHGPLLSAGEKRILVRCLHLSSEAASLQSWMMFRSAGIRRRDSLRYPEEAFDELVEAELGEWSHRVQSLEVLAWSHNMPQLRAILKRAGLRSTGTKASLVMRAKACGHRLRESERFQLRHRPLLTRVLGLYCCRTRRIGEAWELHELGIRHYWTGPRSPALPLMATRADWMEIDEAVRVARDAEMSPLDRLARATQGLRKRHHQAIHRLGPAWAWRRILLSNWTPALKLSPEAGEQALEALAIVDPWEARERIPALARALERAGRSEDGMARCEWARKGASLSQAVELHSTQRCIAKRARSRRPEPLQIRVPGRRRVRLPAAGTGGPRPEYLQEGICEPAEEAVLHSLSIQGRTGFFTENKAWQHLFSALMADLLLAPIAGRLPAPAMARPLDFGLPGFYERRSEAIELRLSRLSQGHGCELLEEGLVKWGGIRVGYGVIGAGPLDALHAIVREVPGPTLASILGALARDWRGTSTGFPDLLILSVGAASSTRLPGAVPPGIPDHHFWIEVKGPGDRLRSGQAAWHHRFLEMSETVEIWELRPGVALQG